MGLQLLMLFSNEALCFPRALSKSIVISFLSALANVLFPWIIQGDFRWYYVIPSVFYFITQFVSTYYNCVREEIEEINHKKFSCNPCVAFNMLTCVVQAAVYDLAYSALTIAIYRIGSTDDYHFSTAAELTILTLCLIPALISTIKTWVEGIYANNLCDRKVPHSNGHGPRVFAPERLLGADVRSSRATPTNV